MSEINFGIIGTGRMAATMMAALTAASGVKILAVSSESKDRAASFAKFHAIPQAYHGIDALLRDERIDAVYIANATENHYQSTLSALNAGKAVLCEKPIAISASESKEIEQAAARAGKLCMEAMWTFFLPTYQRLFKSYEETELGTPLYLYSDFGYPVSKEVSPRLYASTVGSGVLLDRGVYPIALALKLFGPVNQILGKVDRTPEGVDIHAALQLFHNNGAESQLAVSFRVLLQNRAVLSSTGGSISLEPPVIGAESIRISRASLELPTLGIQSLSIKERLKQHLRQSSLLRRINTIKSAGKLEHHTYGGNQYLPLINHFCELYRTDKLVSNVFSLSASTQVLEVIDQANKL